MSGRERGVLRIKQVPKRQRMDLRHVPGAENAEVEYKRSDPRAVVLGEIHNIAEDHDELSDARNSEKDANHCTSHRKHKCSNSPANHGKRNDSSTSTYKENYSANTLTNGAIRRRSLDKDLRDASKTPSSRLTSSKGTVTASVTETDDEPDDEDCIKPVSLSAKKSNKIYSDSDSDSDDSLPSLESPSSTGKRKGSDTDGDDEDDGQDKNKSSKKKFKRTKRNVTPPQETRKSVDTTEKKRVGTKKTDGDQDSSRSSSCSSSSGSNTDSSDSNISDTNSYQSEDDNSDDNSDDQLVEEGPLEELGDDEGTLDLLRHYIRWFALKAGGENVDDNIYKETVDAKKRLDGRLEVFIDICQSQAWGPNFRADVMKYPKFVDHIKREDLKGGDMRYLGNCQVCNRESHPWSEIVKLEGEPYNKETFQTIASEDEEDCVELPPVEYYMGRFCHLRSKLYHKLYHFGYHLYQRCKEMMEELVDDDDRIETVATDMSMLREMYTKLKKWMNKAKKDYTTKNGERTNNKWAREYVLI